MIKETLKDSNQLKEQFNPNNQINPEFLSLLNRNLRDFISPFLERSKENYQEMPEISEKIFGRPVSCEDFRQLFSLDDYGLNSETLVQKDVASMDETGSVNTEAIRVISVFYQRLKDGSLDYKGLARACFFRDPDSEKNVMHTNAVKLEKSIQKNGLGTVIVLQREKFCQENGVNEIWGAAHTFDNYVGAYASASQGGYEFKDSNELQEIRDRFQSYAASKRIFLDDQVLDRLKRPQDFARFKAEDEDGLTRPIGKEFLLDENEEVFWQFRLKLPLDGEALKERKNFLDSRGKKDLIEKYYS